MKLLKVMLNVVEEEMLLKLLYNGNQYLCKPYQGQLLESKIQEALLNTPREVGKCSNDSQTI